MAYAILRVEKTKNTSIAGKNSHNMRLRKTHNADPNLKSQNRILIGSGDLRTDINARFQATVFIVLPVVLKVQEGVVPSNLGPFMFRSETLLI